MNDDQQQQPTFEPMSKDLYEKIKVDTLSPSEKEMLMSPYDIALYQNLQQIPDDPQNYFQFIQSEDYFPYPVHGQYTQFAKQDSLGQRVKPKLLPSKSIKKQIVANTKGTSLQRPGKLPDTLKESINNYRKAQTFYQKKTKLQQLIF